ncbi:MAG: PhzF family phenazine biosynthesis isomerase [Amaricoccus sp.]
MPIPEVTARTDVDVRTVRAFTVASGGGNPAGVVLDADALTAEEMQAIAARVGLSETVFISRSRTEGVKLDFFTPTRRIAHCGHATIAAFTLLRETGRIAVGETSKETVDGPRRIVVANDRVFMAQCAPHYTPAGDVAPLAAVLSAVGASAEALAPEVPLTVSDTGGAFLLLPLRAADELAALRPDHAALPGSAPGPASSASTPSWFAPKTASMPRPGCSRRSSASRRRGRPAWPLAPSAPSCTTFSALARGSGSSRAGT